MSIGDRVVAVVDQVLEDRGDVGGAVFGVAVGDQKVSLARGIANLNTRQAFTEDTGWLLGSVTKVLTTTVLMRLVDRGLVDLDAAATAYVPDFALREEGMAERITVRMLINHTNGIDADALVPAQVRGRDASRSYVAALRGVGVLFDPGTCLHYSNPGFVLAARIIEEQTRLPFERAIQHELFDPCGMRDATAVQTQALLRRTAIGAFADPVTDGIRATTVFTLPESMAGAGTTPIVTVADMIAFGRMHLRGGLAPNGERVLSATSAEAMRTPTFDLGIPQAPPIGLGWWLIPVAGTTAAAHGGASPGGLSSFVLLPEHDAVIVGFTTGPGGRVIHADVHAAIIEALTGRTATPPVELAPSAPGPELVGEYAAFQSRIVVERDGDTLLVTKHFEPIDEEHRQVLGQFGLPLVGPTVPYTSVAPGQFAPVGMDLDALGGVFGRMELLATLPAADGRRAGLHNSFRYTPKVRG